MIITRYKHDPCDDIHAVIKVVIAEVAAAYFITFVAVVVLAATIILYATGQ